MVRRRDGETDRQNIFFDLQRRSSRVRGEEEAAEEQRGTEHREEVNSEHREHREEVDSEDREHIEEVYSEHR